MRVFITGLGIISPAGSGPDSINQALSKNRSFLTPLHLFEPGADAPMPAGQVNTPGPSPLPRTHDLAIHAAKQALGQRPPPESIFLGCTTGGMPLTEELILSGEENPELFSLHGTGTVAQSVAQRLGCTGPVFTVSTACSSSALAIALAVIALRTGNFSTVLAGGADSLCRLTYFGFHMLQLVDPLGARPLDIDRAGMSVSEGAAMMLLQASETPPETAVGEILGVGMSCDAYHPTAPHPQGVGARRAMQNALQDARTSPSDVHYINLHGTGTQDNDRSEAGGVLNLFGKTPPPVSSTKGIFGHGLAASGAIEAVVCLDSIKTQTVPPNTGCLKPDPALELFPVTVPVSANIKNVLSNSFGFGGNNASLLFSPVVKNPTFERNVEKTSPWLGVRAHDCVTGAGFLDQTQKALNDVIACAGIFPAMDLVSQLPKRSIRRVKRLSKMALALGANIIDDEKPTSVHQVHFATGWGPVSETFDFLHRLFSSPNRLASPTDFIGSVHNAPAGHLAIKYRATGPSATATDNHLAFEQALFITQLLSRESENTLLVAADEYHSELTPVLDPICAKNPSDGGAAFLLGPHSGEPVKLKATLLGKCDSIQHIALRINQSMPAQKDQSPGYALVMLRIQQNLQDQDGQLKSILRGLLPDVTIVEYEHMLGSFATVSACATALAVNWVHQNEALTGSIPEKATLNGKGILILNLGEYSAAVEVMP